LVDVGFGEMSRKVPVNYLLTGAFTLSEAYLVSFICNFYEPTSVLFCGLLTLGITVGLTLHAMTTQRDYSATMGTVCGNSGALSGVISIAVVLSLFNIFVRSSFLDNVLAVGFALIYLVYLLVDTQLIMGGEKKQFKLSLDDYILGTMILYMDIVGLFLQLLKLLGKKKDKE
jgi:FtsH-binding integral membrane protein